MNLILWQRKGYLAFAFGVGVRKTPPRQVLLGNGFFLGQQRQNHELVGRQFKRGKTSIRPPVQSKVGAPQVHGENMAGRHDSSLRGDVLCLYTISRTPAGTESSE